MRLGVSIHDNLSLATLCIRGRSVAIEQHFVVDAVGKERQVPPQPGWQMSCGRMPAMFTAPSQRASTWSRYWSSGAMHSCVGSYDERYAGPIGDFWRSGFTALPPAGRVLDIASGNGPLPRLLLSLAERPDLSCDAVDLAELAPPWLEKLAESQRERVRFHSACPAEQLPFADASFDLVVSQWGIEYSDLSRSVPELLRVLKPGGAVRLLLHHQQALPVVLAAEEIAHLEWLLQPGGFMQACADMLAPMALAASAEGRARLQRDAQANACRERFNVLQDQLQSRVDRGQCPDVLVEVRQSASQLLALAAQSGEAAARQRWQILQTGLEDASFRLQELRSHSLDEAAARALASNLAASGPYTLEPLKDRDAIMGWALSLTRLP